MSCSLHFPVWIKSLHVPVGDELFPSFSPSKTSESLSLLSWKKCSAELHCLPPPFITFTTKTRHTTHILANYLHSLLLPVRFNYHTNIFFPLLCETNSKEDTSPATTTFICSWLVLTVKRLLLRNQPP